MNKMTHFERIAAVMEGRPVDRPPFVAWGPHLNLEDRHVGDFTKAVIAYQNQHDFDLLKVMQNGLYFAEDHGQIIEEPCNSDDAGFKKTRVPAINSLEAMRNFRKKDVHQGAFGREIESIKILCDYYKDHTPVLPSVFGPFRMFCHMCGYYSLPDRNQNFIGGNIMDFIKAHEEEYFLMIEELSEQIIDLMNGFLDVGAAGFFFCPGGTYEPTTDEDYFKYIWPYDQKVLEAVHDRSFFTMLHICGMKVYNMDHMLNLPAHGINWEDASPHNPTIEQIRRKTDKVLMGGIDRNSDFYGGSRERVKATLKMKVNEAIRQGGDKLVVAVGCESPREITHRFVVWHEVMDELAER